VPVHPTQLRAGARNIHGHLHARAIDDPRYVCVSLEQTDFRPVPIDRV
jgi:calcineurin-like phosphoesterase family protein